MEEITIEKKQDEPVKEKKVYTPPALIVYGKMTELTAAGSGLEPEGQSSSQNKQRP